MKKTKKEFRWFTIPQYKQEQEYLQDMHRKGWKLTGVTWPGMYHFEECIPEEVVYQLDYQTNVTDKSEYIQMFHDCGWEYMFDFVGYSYFRKPVAQMDGPEEIFCDDESRLDMMRRVFKARVMPLICLFCCCIVPQFLMYSVEFKQRPFNQYMAITFFILFMIYIVLFVSFGIQFYKYKKSITKG